MATGIALPAGIISSSRNSGGRWERSLLKREVMQLGGDGPLRLVCLDGVLWITVEGRAGDIILGCSQSLTLARGEVATIQALRPARMAANRF